MERAAGLYGRRKGKPLSRRRERAMAAHFSRLSLDLAGTAPADPAALFPGRPASVCLEIGFGGGEHLIAAAAAAPATGFIGVEPYLNGMARAVSEIAALHLANVRLFDGEASRLLDWLPPDSLDLVDLPYPDPWPKKRHWKRRIVNRDNLDRLARVLKRDGTLRLVSDVPAYVEWMLRHLLPRSDFVWTAAGADDWRKPFPGWPGTRYEAKAIAAGRHPTYLTFRRV